MILNVQQQNCNSGFASYQFQKYLKRVKKSKMIWALSLLLYMLFIVRTDALDCPSNPTKQQLLNATPECFMKLYDDQKFNGPQLVNEVKKRINNIENYLQQLHMNTISYINAQPVIKWAQSQTQIFINFKLSHRFDSPPCSDIKDQHFQIIDVQYVDGKDIDITQTVVHPYTVIENKTEQVHQQSKQEKSTIHNQQLNESQNVKINNQTNPANETQNQHLNKTDVPQKVSQSNDTQKTDKQQVYSPRIFPSSVSFQGQCYLTHQKFRYKLNITLNYALNRISIRKQSLGSYTLIGDKNITMVWRKPFATHHKMSIWSQMREKYQSAMDQYFKIVEDQQDKQNKKTRRRRRRRPNTNSNSDQTIKDADNQVKETGQEL